jgi:hypothetical protein
MTQLTPLQTSLIDKEAPDYVLLARTNQDYYDPRDRMVRYQPPYSGYEGHYLLRSKINPNTLNRFTKSFHNFENDNNNNNAKENFLPRVESVFIDRDPSLGIRAIVENMVTFDYECAKTHQFMENVRRFFTHNQVGKLTIGPANFRMAVADCKVLLVDLIEEEGPREIRLEYIDHIQTILDLHKNSKGAKAFHLSHMSYLFLKRFPKPQLASLNISDLANLPSCYDPDFLNRIYVATNAHKSFMNKLIADGSDEEHKRTCKLDHCDHDDHAAWFAEALALAKTDKKHIVKNVVNWMKLLSNEEKNNLYHDFDPNVDDDEGHTNGYHFKRQPAHDYIDAIRDNKNKRIRMDSDEDAE